MALEPRNDTMDMSNLIWNNSNELADGTNVTSLNTTDIADTFEHSEIIAYIMTVSVTVLISLCGMMGNGTVVWLLGFRLKRNPYSVYILNLAVADFLYLLGDIFEIIFLNFFFTLFPFPNALALSSYPVGLILLVAISTERCVSVLWPLWYKCHRPAHLSTIVCALIWLLFFGQFSLTIVSHYVEVSEQYIPWELCNAMPLLTLPMLFVSSLILFIWGLCCSRQRQPSKLYLTILLNVLAVLLLNVHRGVDLVLRMSDSYLAIPWETVILLSALNSAINPIIYFFVGRHGKHRGRKTLREVLQSALADEERRKDSLSLDSS